MRPNALADGSPREQYASVKKDSGEADLPQELHRGPMVV
jgi:hypothetical protein